MVEGWSFCSGAPYSVNLTNLLILQDNAICYPVLSHITLDYLPIQASSLCERILSNAVYCAITALDRYPSHSENIHYIRSATLIYVLLPSTDHAITSILDTPYTCLF